ncbi:MAG TPA: HyaD/HybD family hydrogenase maturation endopeptidase [Silvibacterium sp.]|nr:HyaD/HybD family hydrogenase maturation endopeptidase [Silvibacterium sp.]
MSMDASPNIAALGLGNLMRTDDGVGIHAIRRLLESDRLPRGVEVIEGGTLGLDLLPRLEGMTHVLAVDAVEFGGPPGTLYRFANRDLNSLPAGKSVHLLGFSDLVNALRLLGEAPSEVVLLGVQPESTDWGVALSPSVAAALNELLEAALSEIAEWLEPETAGMTLYRDADHI